MQKKQTTEVQQQILEWLDRLPTAAMLEKAAGLPQGHLSRCRAGMKMRPATLEKVIRAARRYGFKQ